MVKRRDQRRAGVCAGRGRALRSALPITQRRTAAKPSAPARRASRTEPPVNTTKLIIENVNYFPRIFSAPFVSSPSEDLAFLVVDYPGSSSADSTVLSGEPQTHLQGRLVMRVGPEERCFRL